MIDNDKYLICIGTSHLNGNCDGDLISHTYADEVAKLFNVRVKRISLAGIENIELLQLTNEINHELLTEKCVGVIADVRIGSRKEFVPWSSVTQTLPAQSLTNNVIGIYDNYKKRVASGYKVKLAYQNLLNRLLYYTVGPGSNTVRDSMNDFPLRVDQSHTHNLFSNVMIKKTIEHLDHALAHQSMPMKVLQDYTHLLAIQNIVQAKGIPFAWWCFEKIDMEHIPQYTNFDNTVFDTLIDVTPALWDNQVKCKCFHLNATGHKKLGKEIVARLGPNWLRM